jgi:hypothetical protein
MAPGLQNRVSKLMPKRFDPMFIQVSVFTDPTNKVLKGTKTDNFSEEFLKNKILVPVP